MTKWYKTWSVIATAITFKIAVAVLLQTHSYGYTIQTLKTTHPPHYHKFTIPTCNQLLFI